MIALWPFQHNDWFIRSSISLISHLLTFILHFAGQLIEHWLCLVPGSIPGVVITPKSTWWVFPGCALPYTRVFLAYIPPIAPKTPSNHQMSLTILFKNDHICVISMWMFCFLFCFCFVLVVHVIETIISTKYGQVMNNVVHTRLVSDLFRYCLKQY